MLLSLLERLEAIDKLSPPGRHWPTFHPAARRLMAGWGYRYDAWSLRRFQPPKRYAVVLCFLQAALAETANAVGEVHDKLITSIHGKAKKRREALLRASEEAKRRAVTHAGALRRRGLDRVDLACFDERGELRE